MIVSNLDTQTREEREPKMDFVAFDFETADYDNSAPCSIGLAVVKGGKIVDELHYLINPEVEFSPYTIEIHGITPESVQGAPTFPDVWDEIMPYFVNYPIVAHNAAFDINVLRKVCARYEIDFPEIECYCTMEIARKQLHEDSLKLTDLCSKYGIACECHHNAGRDAAACANLMLCMLDQGIQIQTRFTSCKLEDNEDDEEDDCEYFGVVVAHRSKKPKARRRENIRPSDIHPSVEKFDESNPLYGKNIVFTGELSISRSEAMQIAVDAGAIVKSSVSRKTDYLVVGMQDIAIVGDDGLSTKEEKAYMLNDNGCAKIEFLNEVQFLALAKGGAYCGANDV